MHEYLAFYLGKKHENLGRQEPEPKKMPKKKNVRKKAFFFEKLCYNGVKIRNVYLFFRR